MVNRSFDTPEPLDDGPPLDFDSLMPPEPDFDSAPPPDFEPPDIAALLALDEPDPLLARIVEAGGVSTPERDVEPDWDTFGTYSMTDTLEPPEDLLDPASVAQDFDIATFGQDLPPVDYQPDYAALLEVPEPARELYDARLWELETVTAAGTAALVVQAVELYSDADGQFSARAFEVGTFDSQEDYHQTVASIAGHPEGDPLSMWEQVEAWSYDNGNTVGWYEASPEQVEQYVAYLGLDGLERDTPEPELAAREGMLLQACEVADLSAARAQLEHELALLAMAEKGIQPPDDFDLQRDSFLDEQTGLRVVSGIFQADPDSPAQAMAVFLGASGGHAIEADVVAFGEVGTWDQAQGYWQQFDQALYEGGPGRAFETLDDIQTQLDREGLEIDPAPPAYAGQEMEL